MFNLTGPGEYVVDAAKLAPPTVVTATTVGGVGLQEWVYIVTIVYTLLMIAQLIWKTLKGKTDGG